MIILQFVKVNMFGLSRHMKNNQVNSCQTQRIDACIHAPYPPPHATWPQTEWGARGRINQRQLIMTLTCSTCRTSQKFSPTSSTRSKRSSSAWSQHTHQSAVHRSADKNRESFRTLATIFRRADRDEFPYTVVATLHQQTIVWLMKI